MEPLVFLLLATGAFIALTIAVTVLSGSALRRLERATQRELLGYVADGSISRPEADRLQGRYDNTRTQRVGRIIDAERAARTCARSACCDNQPRRRSGGRRATNQES